jgi:hypothetical protein
MSDSHIVNGLKFKQVECECNGLGKAGSKCNSDLSKCECDKCSIVRKCECKAKFQTKSRSESEVRAVLVGELKCDKCECGKCECGNSVSNSSSKNKNNNLNLWENISVYVFFLFVFSVILVGYLLIIFSFLPTSLFFIKIFVILIIISFVTFIYQVLYLRAMYSSTFFNNVSNVGKSKRHLKYGVKLESNVVDRGRKYSINGIFISSNCFEKIKQDLDNSGIIYEIESTTFSVKMSISEINTNMQLEIEFQAIVLEMISLSFFEFNDRQL